MSPERIRKLRHCMELLTDSIQIHGCNYISNPRLHISERFIWLMTIQLAVFGTIYACVNQYNRYYIRPTVMSVEKDFRTWEGTLPAGTLCFESNLDQEKAEKYVDSILNGSDNDTAIDHETFMNFLRAILNTSAADYERLSEFSGEEFFESIDIIDLIMKLRLPMEKKIKISTNDPNIKIQLQPIILEKGLCYTFNTAIANAMGREDYKGPKILKPLGCRYGRQECNLKLDLGGFATAIDIHSPYDFSDVASTTFKTEGDDEIFGTFKVMETVAADSLRELSPNQRRCLYPDEAYPIFGKSICFMKCRSKIALDMCNCVPHFYPYVDGPKCTPSGYECLLDFQWPGWLRTGCNCSRTCVEIEYSVLQITKRMWNVDDNLGLALRSAITIELAPPKVRNRISVVFSFEDMLVSFGGAASLFLGFSFLAALQTIFYWVNYFITYLLEERRRRHQVSGAVV